MFTRRLTTLWPELPFTYRPCSAAGQTWGGTVSDTPQGPGWWQASDGKFYPPQGEAPPEKKGGCLKFGLIGLGLVIALIAIAAVMGRGEDDGDTAATRNDDAPAGIEDDDAPPLSEEVKEEKEEFIEDIDNIACSPGQFGPEVKVTLTNRSSKESSYVLTVSLMNEGGVRVGEANGAANNVKPDQQALVDLIGTGEGVTKCEIANITRFDSSK